MKEWDISIDEKDYLPDTKDTGCEKQYKQVVKRAMNILQRQDRTEKQLRDKLISDQRFSDEEIEYAIRYVTSYRYLDDLRFACNYVRFRCNTKSKQQLLFGLLGKGISKENINIALEEEYQGEESLLIRNFLEKKGYYLDDSSPKVREKLIASLMRKGFSFDEIIREMNRI